MSVHGRPLPGSPPHAWGRRRIRSGPLPPLAVHPHMRGDGGEVTPTIRTISGSPPHAWGRQRDPLMVAKMGRFTPTCVGTARLLCGDTLGRTVHPHMRGDGEVYDWAYEADTGSPPHAWGRRRPLGTGQRGTRFTPTCVGTACPSHPYRPCPPVHPHMRGDGLIPVKSSSTSAGSPPHAWGRRRCREGRSSPCRFTPTCVGTASPATATCPRPPVHPHMRGDGWFPASASGTCCGSPPHAWGRRAVPAAELTDRRFTPTCVGTAACEWRSSWSHPVHPHMRGDGPGTISRTRLRSGSPPHAWGRRGRLPLLIAHLRFTPTCVGTATCDPLSALL